MKIFCFKSSLKTCQYTSLAKAKNITDTFLLQKFKYNYLKQWSTLQTELMSYAVKTLLHFKCVKHSFLKLSVNKLKYLSICQIYLDIHIYPQIYPLGLTLLDEGCIIGLIYLNISEGQITFFFFLPQTGGFVFPTQALSPKVRSR